MLTLAAARHISDGGRDTCTLLPYRSPSEDIRKEFEAEGFNIVGVRDHPFKALWASKSGSIFIGGGHSVRNNVSLGWLFFTLIASKLAQLSGRRVRVVGSGATTVTSKRKKWLFAKIFSTCDKICLRDNDSKKFLVSDFPALHTKVELTGDLAFLKDCVRLQAGAPEQFTGLISPGIDLSEGRHENLSEIMELLRVMIDKLGMHKVMIVSHDSRENLGGSFCANLARQIRSDLSVDVDLINSSRIQDGLLNPYARAKWIITGRLHGLIVGALYGRKVFYTTGSAGKLRPFAEIFGYHAASYLNDANKFDDTEAIRKTLIIQQRAAESNFEI